MTKSSAVVASFVVLPALADLPKEGAANQVVGRLMFFARRTPLVVEVEVGADDDDEARDEGAGSHCMAGGEMSGQSETV